MKKALVFAGLLSGALMFATGSSAQPDTVEVKLTIDRAEPAAVTYAKVQREATRVCQKDSYCKAALMDALLTEIGDEALLQIHAEKTDRQNAFQIASADQG